MKKFCRQWLENWRQDCRHFHRWQRPCRNDRGAALLEFALGLPILLIITVFLFEMALFWEGRILGNHASFALARIAKVHYQPGLKKEEQVYFPEKCLLNSGYLETRARLQSQLSTERLVTAFFLFPVTRQKIKEQHEISTLNDISKNQITTMNNGLMNIIVKIETASLRILSNEMAHNLTTNISDTIFDDDKLKNLLPKMGDGVAGMIISEIASVVTSKALENIFSPIFEKTFNTVFDFMIEQSASFFESHLNPFKSILATFNDNLSNINDNIDKITHSPGFLIVDFLGNCYSRYDLACQRVNPATKEGAEITVKEDRLIPDEEEAMYDLEEDPSFWEQLVDLFSSLNPFQSSDDANSQFNDWKEETKGYRNKTLGALRFPRHAIADTKYHSDAEAVAKVITVSLTYPVKAHWFSLTVAMAENNIIKPTGMIKFTCKQAALAELPKQNIEKYYFEYKTIGEAGGFGSYLGTFFSKMGGILKEIRTKREIKINVPGLQEWVAAQNARRERQQLIIDELSNVETLFADTTEAKLKTQREYAHSIAGAEKAIDDLSDAIEDILGKEATEEEEKVSGLKDDYILEREECYTTEWDEWDDKIDVIVEFAGTAAQYLTNLKNAINGTSKAQGDDTDSPSYEVLVSNESTAWANLIKYYNETLYENIDKHESDAAGYKNPQLESGEDFNVVEEIPSRLATDENMRPKILEKLQYSLDESRKSIKKDIFAAIANCSDYDLFIPPDPFDSSGPKGLTNQDDVYRLLNQYYKTSSVEPNHFYVKPVDDE